MLFSWLRKRRRRNILAVAFPEAWLAILQERVGHYELLAAADQKKLRDAVQIMIAEKEWEGCRGLEVTDDMRVIIAALAAILILGFEPFYFDNVATVLVYPNAFVIKGERALVGSATVEEEEDVLGVANRRGPVILSWAEVQENASAPGYGKNLVFHEFAHQLDMLNGAFDGTPNLPTADLAKRWTDVMDKEFRRLDQAERGGRDTLLDPYGATNPAEFFAVATECFFDAPRAMQCEYRTLYELFRDYYRQDPAAWRAFEEQSG